MGQGPIRISVKCFNVVLSQPLIVVLIVIVVVLAPDSDSTPPAQGEKECKQKKKGSQYLNWITDITRGLPFWFHPTHKYTTLSVAIIHCTSSTVRLAKQSVPAPPIHPIYSHSPPISKDTTDYCQRTTTTTTKTTRTTMRTNDYKRG